MTQAPIVSILLPCLNARAYLETRVESLLAQTYQKWEAIVLDSHSSDGTWEFFETVAARDPRFRLHRIPREGLYAALNRGLELATGEFLHVATCDDAMVPEFLSTMLGALEQCPQAGIAVCDLLLINRNGDKLTGADVAASLQPKAASELLGVGRVRDVGSGKVTTDHTNFRPPPHDCLLHFSGKSVYFSLTQLVVRRAMAKRAGPFDTTVGSIGDFGWLLRLTNLTGTVHVPKKLAAWRFHGDQLSVYRDESRLSSMKMMFERVLPEIYQRHYPLLNQNDCSTLLLPSQRRLALSFFQRVPIWIEAALRLLWMFLKQPAAMTRAVYANRFQIPSVRNSLVPIVLRRVRCIPQPLNTDHQPAAHR